MKSIKSVLYRDRTLSDKVSDVYPDGKFICYTPRSNVYATLGEIDMLTCFFKALKMTKLDSMFFRLAIEVEKKKL